MLLLQCLFLLNDLFLIDYGREVVDIKCGGISVFRTIGTCDLKQKRMGLFPMLSSLLSHLINSIFTELYMVLMEQDSCSNRMLNKGVAEEPGQKFYLQVKLC